MPWIPILVIVALIAFQNKVNAADKLSVVAAFLTGFKPAATGEFNITLMLAIKNPTSIAQSFTSIYGTATINNFAPVQFNNAIGATIAPNTTTNVPITITIAPGTLVQVIMDVFSHPLKATMAIKSILNVGPFAVPLNKKWDMEKLIKG